MVDKIYCPHCRKKIDMEVPLANNEYIKALERRITELIKKGYQK